MDDLASEYHRSISWVQKQIYEYEPVYKIHNTRAVNLVCDATFYGKRKDKLGTLVFKDSITKEVLTWKHIQSETIKEYARAKRQSAFRVQISVTFVKSSE